MSVRVPLPPLLADEEADDGDLSGDPMSRWFCDDEEDVSSPPDELELLLPLPSAAGVGCDAERANGTAADVEINECCIAGMIVVVSGATTAVTTARITSTGGGA